MTEALRVGVIGAGYFSGFHCEAWSRLPGAQLVAVGDRHAPAAQAMAARFPGVAAYDGARAMLDAQELDLLDIATPPATHAPLCRLAIARGLDLICQKPFGGSLEVARELAAEAAAAGVRLIVHENIRFQPWYRHARAILDQGGLGQVHNISFRLRPGDGQGPEAYLARQPYFQQMGRFLIDETAVHWIDTFRFLMGEVRAVYARTRRLNPVIAGEDAALVVFEFDAGADGLFDGNRLVDHGSDNPRRTMGEMYIEGSSAVLRLDGAGRLWLRAHGERCEQEIDYHWNDRGFGGDCVHALQRHVLAHLRDGAPLENPAQAYLRNLEIEAAIYRSHEQGARILLGPA